MSLIQEALNKAGGSVNPDEMVEEKAPRAVFDQIKPEVKARVQAHVEKEETEFENLKAEDVAEKQPVAKKKGISPWIFAFGFLFVAAAVYFLFFSSVTFTAGEAARKASPEAALETAGDLPAEKIEAAAPIAKSEPAPEPEAAPAEVAVEKRSETKAEVKEAAPQPIFQQVIKKMTPKFISPPVESLSSYGFELTGITSSGNEKLALIDNQVVGVGDFLRDDVRVHQIGARDVILEKGGRRLTIQL